MIIFNRNKVTQRNSNHSNKEIKKMEINKPDENSITTRFRLQRTNYGNRFEIKDQDEKKFMEGKIALNIGLKFMLKLMKRSKSKYEKVQARLDGEDKETVREGNDEAKYLTYFSLSDASKQPMGEISVCLKETSSKFKIKDSLGEVVATVSGLRISPWDSVQRDVIIETPSQEFKSEKIEVTERFFRFFSRKRIKKVNILDLNDKFCFSIVRIKYELFEINLYKELFDLNPFLICTASFLIANIYWPPPESRGG